MYTIGEIPRPNQLDHLGSSGAKFTFRMTRVGGKVFKWGREGLHMKAVGRAELGGGTDFHIAISSRNFKLNFNLKFQRAISNEKFKSNVNLEFKKYS